MTPTPLSLIVTSNAHAVKVDTDHDSTYDFSTVKTVIWGDCTPTTVELMQKRILAAVEEQLVAAGLTAPDENRQRLVDAGCDVFVCDARAATERFDQVLGELGRQEPGLDGKDSELL